MLDSLKRLCSKCVYLNDKQSNKKGLRQSNQLKGLIFVVKAKKKEGKCLRVCKYTHDMCIYIDMREKGPKILPLALNIHHLHH